MEILKVTTKTIIISQVKYRTGKGKEKLVEFIREENGDYQFATGETNIKRDFGSLQNFINALEESQKK